MSKDLPAKYYQNNKERLQRKLTKDIEQQCGCEQYKNLPEDEKQNKLPFGKQDFRYFIDFKDDKK